LDDEPLIHRREVTAALFAIADLNRNVATILEILKEDENGEETEDDD